MGGEYAGMGMFAPQGYQMTMSQTQTHTEVQTHNTDAKKSSTKESFPRHQDILILSVPYTWLHIDE